MIGCWSSVASCSFSNPIKPKQNKHNKPKEQKEETINNSFTCLVMGIPT